MPNCGVPNPSTDPNEDDLDELPPLDGDAGDTPTLADEDPLPDLGDPDGSDDEPANLEPEDGIALVQERLEPSWVGEASDNPQVDLGDSGLLDVAEPAMAAGLDELGRTEDDSDLAEAFVGEGADSGEEGPVDADDELRDRDLPALDADEEGDLGDDDRTGKSPLADEPIRAMWAEEPWRSVGAPVQLGAVRAMAQSGRGVVVAVAEPRESAPPQRQAVSAKLFHVDLEGNCQSIAGGGLDDIEIDMLAADRPSAGVVAALSSHGRLFVSSDAGRRFRPCAGPLLARVAVAGATVWGRTLAGGLVAWPADAAAAAAVDVGLGGVLAIAGDDQGLVAVAADASGGLEKLILRRLDAAAECQSLVGAGVAIEPSADVSSAATRAGYFACVSDSRVYRIGPTGRFEDLGPWSESVATVAFIDDAGTLLVAVTSDVDATAALVRVDASASRALVAHAGVGYRVPGRACDVSLTVDRSRGVVWVAGDFGVEAFSMASR
jgi:hypothetical protein